MSRQVLVEIEMPESLHQFKLPAALNERLQNLLDRQDRGETLTESERKEAEGLVELAELLSLLRRWEDIPVKHLHHQPDPRQML